MDGPVRNGQEGEALIDPLVRPQYSFEELPKSDARSAVSLSRHAGPNASALLLSDSVVLVSGMWQVEWVADGKPTLMPLRVNLVVTKRGDRWLIAQFHNSPRSKPR